MKIDKAKKLKNEHGKKIKQMDGEINDLATKVENVENDIRTGKESNKDLEFQYEEMKKQLHNEKKLLSTLAKKFESTKTVLSNK
jgi:archaellum component FlaC